MSAWPFLPFANPSMRQAGDWLRDVAFQMSRDGSPAEDCRNIQLVSDMLLASVDVEVDSDDHFCDYCKREMICPDCDGYEMTADINRGECDRCGDEMICPKCDKTDEAA